MNKTTSTAAHPPNRAALICLLCCLSLMLPGRISAQEDAVVLGLEIVRTARDLDRGFQNSSAELKMVLVDRHGEESVRTLRTMIMEKADDGNLSLSVFDLPADIKGTALLTHAHKIGDDDQWLYLPALKRVKRIAARNKSGSFMGSEFAYEDIAGQELEKHTYRWLKDEPLAGLECRVVEMVPVDRFHSGYSRLVTWRDREEMRLQRVDYYDRRDALLKTLTCTGYQRYLDRYWRAETMTMINHQTGKKTILTWSGFRFRSGLSARDFRPDSLRNIR